MSMVVTIEEAKRHLNLDDGFTDDDAYILQLVQVSECAVCDRIRVKSFEDEFGDKAPNPVMHAVLLMLANLYNNREPVAFGQAYVLPLSFDFLLAPYVRYSSYKKVETR